MTEQSRVIEPAAPPKPVGIGGWLILPAICLVLGATALTVNLIAMITAFFSPANIGADILSANEIIAAMVLAVSFLYTAGRFFRRKSDAPYIMISLMTLSIFFLSPLFSVNFFEYYYAGIFSPRGPDVLIGCIIYAAIWIPYFLRSGRVKNTFVKD